MIRIAPILALGLIAQACSTYNVVHEEWKDGFLVQKTEITKHIPIGGKDASEGSAAIEVNEDGDWSIKIGEQSDTDMTGTAALMIEMFQAGKLAR